jgi:hypothetical protein
MTITCVTTDAAVTVLAALIDAGLAADRDFQTAIVAPLGPPIIFTILVALPPDVLRQLHATPDTALT